MTLATDEQIAQFLGDIGWYESRAQKQPADWSSRYYIRIHKTTFTADRDEKAVLLVSPPDNSPDSVAGHRVGDLISINTHLHGLGIRVPQIIAMDEALGLVLMEDFGRTHLGRLEGQGQRQLEAYDKATKILIDLRDNERALDIKPPLMNYRDGHVYKALSFLPDYYPPAKNLDKDTYLNAWDEIMDKAEAECPNVFTHIDYFADNIMLLDDKEIGVLDYQGAVKGFMPYDLVNLLEDARRDIPTQVKQHCKKLYRDSLDDEKQREAFDLYYPVFAAQFHARVLGQIFKLSETIGRSDLLAHKVRLECYLRAELKQSPMLAQILAMFEQKSIV
jgi:hypothetical protein